MAWPKLRKRRSLVTFSNRGGAAAPTPASGGDESGSGESVRLLWPGGNGARAAPAVASRVAPGIAEAPEAAAPVQGTQAAADPDDLPFWDWSADQSELDDPSDAFAPDRPEYPDGPDRPDYSYYRASASADPTP